MRYLQFILPNEMKIQYVFNNSAYFPEWLLYDLFLKSNDIYVETCLIYIALSFKEKLKMIQVLKFRKQK